MASINVAKAFNLNLLGVITAYAVGVHEVSDEVANHSYTQHFLAKPQEPAKTEPPVKTEAEIAAETAAVVRGLATEEKPVPNMDVINPALKEAGLPEIKAADRDALLAAK